MSRVIHLLISLVIGLLVGLLIAERISLRFHWREFVFVGLLGGFTTYSTFGLDTITLLRTQSLIAVASNVLAHLTVGLLAVYLGILVGSRG